MIDIHNHIIPEIDDGALDLDMALAMLRMAEQQGVTHLVCTPHMHPGRFENSLDTIKPAFESLVNQVEKEGLAIQLAMGAEVRISDEFMIQLRQQQVPFIGEWEGKPAVLLEMPHAQVPTGIEQLLMWVEKQGVQPIIAHPERNKEIMKNPDRIYELVDRGALLQLTAGSVAGQFGESAEQLSHWLLDRRLITFIASDAHRTERRAPAMALAREVLKADYGESVAQALTWSNPAKLCASLFGADL